MITDSINLRTSLFENPLKENITLTQRVTIIAFHVLTLGIPLAIYCAIDCCFPEGLLSLLLPNSGVIETALEKLKKSRNIAHYSKLEQEALDFANQKLIEHADITPRIEEGLDKPVNLDILKLLTIGSDIYWRSLEKALKDNQDNSWSNEAVIKAYDECLKIAYAISVLTLEDLPAFAAKRPKEDQALAKSLTSQRGYLSTTIYFCAAIYRHGRGGVVWLQKKRDSGVQYPAGLIPDAHSALFYQDGTIQSNWRELYNAYSDRIRMYVPEVELNQERPEGDVRLSRMTAKDLFKNTYKMFGS